MNHKQNIILFAIIIVTALLAWRMVADTDRARENDGAEHRAQAANSHGRQAEERGSEHEDGAIVQLSAAQISAAGLVIGQAGPARILTTLTLPGEIRFNEDRTAHIVPRVDGIVESVAVDLGQQVKKGQVLATLASPGISELRSNAMAAQKRLALARKVYEREKELWEDRISAEQDYLQALQALQEAEITVQNASQKLRAIGAGDGGGNLNRYELRAPFDGMIVERHLALGESVQANANVMTLADLSSVWAEIIVSAKDLDTVKVGSPVTVRAAAFESQAQGVVAYVGSLLGEQTRTATARVTLPNPARAWRPGLFVNVAIVTGEAEVPLAVGAQAVQTLEGSQVVFVRHGDGFRAAPVETGRTDGKLVEIVSGLDAGTAYVLDGSFVLKSELGKAMADHAH